MGVCKATFTKKLMVKRPSITRVGGDLCPVQEQGEHHGTGHLRQHEGHEIGSPPA